MALKQTIELTDNFGVLVTLSDVYIKIVRLEGSKESIDVTLFFYKEPNGSVYLQANHSFMPDLNSQYNFIAQAYNYLKTLPEFEGAEDC